MKEFNCRRSQGFTLIEVLSAFTVFTLVFATVLGLSTASMRIFTSAQTLTEIAFWSESMLEEITHEKNLRPGIRQGNFNQRFEWKVVSAPYEPKHGEPGFEDQARSLESTKNDLMLVSISIYRTDEDRPLFNTSTLVSR